MVDIDIHTNSKHFSLFASCRIIEWSKQAMELCEQDREEEAIEIYNNLIDIVEYQDSLYTNRGIAFYEIGDNDKAINDLEKAIALNPQNDLAKEVLFNIMEEKKGIEIQRNGLTMIDILERGVEKDDIQKRIDEGKLKGEHYNGEIYYSREDIANCI